MELGKSAPGIEAFIQKRIAEIAAEEVERARERMKERIPEIAAEIGVRLQQMLDRGDYAAALTIVLRPSAK